MGPSINMNNSRPRYPPFSAVSYILATRHVSRLALPTEDAIATGATRTRIEPHAGSGAFCLLRFSARTCGPVPSAESAASLHRQYVNRKTEKVSLSHGRSARLVFGACVGPGCSRSSFARTHASCTASETELRKSMCVRAASYRASCESNVAFAVSSSVATCARATACYV